MYRRTPLSSVLGYADLSLESCFGTAALVSGSLLGTRMDLETSLAEPAPTEDQICTPEHCYYAFDTLYCALTGSRPIAPKFPDDK